MKIGQAVVRVRPIITLALRLIRAGESRLPRLGQDFAYLTTLELLLHSV